MYSKHLYLSHKKLGKFGMSGEQIKLFEGLNSLGEQTHHFNNQHITKPSNQV